MTDIVERLNNLLEADPDPAMCELYATCKAEVEQLRDMIDNRNEFIAQKGLWRELGLYLSEPHEEPKP